MITTINEFKNYINENLTNNELISLYNKFITFVNNKIELILTREGELPEAYFINGLEERLDNLTNSIKTVNDIRENETEIRNVFNLLKDGYKGLKTSGRI